MNDEISATIEKLENERYESMLAKDVAKLDSLLDERLRYIHSSGVVDTKQSYLSGLSDGMWDYRKITREDQTIVPLGDSALVFNHLMIDLVVKGVQKTVDSNALAVWARSEAGWRLVAVQSAALPKG